MKAREEMAIRKILEENMDIKGGYKRPHVKDVIAVQLFMIPYYVWKFFAWHLRWIWKFSLKRENFGDEEKFYLVRKFLKFSREQFDALPDREHNEFLEKELWIKENFDK